MLKPSDQQKKRLQQRFDGYIRGFSHLYIIYIEGKNERCESTHSPCSIRKVKNKSVTYTQVAPHYEGMRVAFCVIQTKGKSNGDCAAGHVRVLCGADACCSGHLRLVVQEAKGLPAPSFRRTASLLLSESKRTS